MIADWILLGLRVLAPLILYAFLGTMVYHLFKSTSANPMTARLVTVGDDTRIWHLHTTCTIGRDAANTISVEDEFVSAQHARLFLHGDVWWLDDVGSTNGTTLNSVSVTEKCPLNPGDVIGVGNHFFQFETQENA